MVKHQVQRYALLIGVPEYDVVEPNLPVVKNDLQILEKALKSSRFDVRKLGDKRPYAATRSRILREIRQFCDEADEGHTLLLYFSGHGVHHNNKDYLIPSDATLDDPINVKQYLIPVDLSEAFDQCKAKTILFFIDACREGIKIKDSKKGLAKGLEFKPWSQGELRQVADREYAIVFSCGAGQVSRFSPNNQFSFFTKALATALHAEHPAKNFREIGEALQKILDEITREHKKPNQTVKVRAEFDLKLRLLERQICDGNKPSKVHEKPTDISETEAAKIDDTHEPISVGSFTKQPAKYKDPSTHACVLFADLFGLTEFKLDHSENEAARKIVLHNKIASDVVTTNNGIVAKHISDRVMGVFQGDCCEEKAVTAGIAIIKKIDETNVSLGLQYPNDLKTSIGLSCGDVWKFHFDSCGVDDYLGFPVDVAARLCSLAGLQQLICCEDAFQRIQFPGTDWNYSDRFERFIEGLDEPLPVRLVVPQGYELGEIALCGFRRAIPEEARTKLKQARHFLQEKRFDRAFGLCCEILDRDRANFEANVYCAQIILHRVGGNNENRFATLERIVHEYLCVAKQIRPQSSCVWRLLGWAYYLQAIDKRDSSLLSTAYDRAMMALNCAQEHMDVNGEVQARILLALILREQASFDKTKRAENLAKANEYCGETANQVVGFLDRTRSDYLVTQALVQANLGLELPSVEAMLDQARTADPQNPRVHEALAELYRTRERADK
jgi:class 3 adenylate cyclase/uncharacterized caspase-like protein